MIGAEQRRFILLAALAVVAYLLISAWISDSKALLKPAPELTETPLQQAPLDVPTAATIDQQAANDLPVAPTSAVATSEGVSSPNAPDITNQPDTASHLLQIQTDTLHVWIDLRGGDVVRVDLPQYPRDMERRDIALTLLNQTSQFVYVAQSGLVGRDGPDARTTRPLYTVVGRGSNIQMRQGESELVVPLQFTTPEGVQVTKRYRFTAQSYVVGVSLTVVNNTTETWQGNFFAQLKRDGSTPDFSGSSLGPHPFVGAAFTSADEFYIKRDFSDLEEARFSVDTTNGWAAILQHYFLGAWIAPRDVAANYYGERGRDGLYRVGLTTPPIDIAAGQSAEIQSRLFVGPKIQSKLAATAPHLELTVDYGILWIISAALFWLLELLHGVVQNWGVAIIALTVVVKLVLYPLSAASYRSMAKMRQVAPEMRRLQERFGDDKQRLSQEMMEFYKREKVNPLGGCLPMVVQMPVFLALYWVLYESVELRQAPFFAWIQDLSVMDPYLVLPILMGITSYVQTTLSPPMPDPMQARMMKLMPIMFTVLFIFFPAGLVLYWFVNNLLSIAQQWWVTRQVEQQAR